MQTKDELFLRMKNRFYVHTRRVRKAAATTTSSTSEKSNNVV